MVGSINLGQFYSPAGIREHCKAKREEAGIKEKRRKENLKSRQTRFADVSERVIFLSEEETHEDFYGFEGSFKEAVSIFSADNILSMRKLISAYMRGDFKFNWNQGYLSSLVREGALWMPKKGWYFFRDSPLLSPDFPDFSQLFRQGRS